MDLLHRWATCAHYCMSPCLPLWTYTIRRNNLKCFETSYYSKLNEIWWFKWCLHLTLSSRSSAHTLQMSNTINPIKPLLHRTWQAVKTLCAADFPQFGCFCTVKAVLVSWTPGRHCHSISKAWQNDYSLKSAHPKITS